MKRRPRNVVRVATTVHHRWLPTREQARIIAAPAPVTSQPPMWRSLLDPRLAGAATRRASIGATRAADHAGRIAASVVTTSPTAKATTTVRVSTAAEVLGTSI